MIELGAVRSHLLKKVLPFAITLAVGASLAWAFASRRGAQESARASVAYGGVYEGGKVFVQVSPYRVSLVDVTRKAVVLAKPDPLYTDEARLRGTTGEVRLRVLLDSSGAVTKIEPLMTLPDGLTESAVDAARRINFTPAEIDGRPVSQFVTISYSFDLQ
ncbi:MAG: TonB family protein [Acidobacteriota bacterium]|nr:TonB family protein [Acidobacteriota bacterium]